MVEHAVEHDADAPGVRLVDHPAQGGVAAEHRVDLLVVVRVVAMVRRRLEDRREVHGIDAQVHQVIQVLDHADQVAPLVAVVGRGAPHSSRCRGLGTVTLRANRSGKIW